MLELLRIDFNLGRVEAGNLKVENAVLPLL
jgi:hypothetical protein